MTTDSLPPGAPRAVLHPTDFSAASEIAFAHALKIALQARARFYVLHTESSAREGSDIDWRAFPGVRSTLARWGLLEDGSPAEAVFERLGVRVSKVDILDDDPVRGIVRFLSDHPSDLIVLATEGRDGWQRWLHRSVAEPLARETSVPALFLPHGAKGFVEPETGRARLARVLLPMDSDPRPDAAIEAAAGLVALLDAGDCDLHLLHVGDAARAPAAHVQGESFARVETSTREGGVVDTIIDMAGELDADLIVMATQGHKGFLDALRGSTTEQVLRRASCPVLAVPAS
jgi:nucleotide-binding universal stress UspA family protein